jgi:hypothetical protein
VVWTGNTTTTHGCYVRLRRLLAISHGDDEVAYEPRNRNEHHYIRHKNNSYGKARPTWFLAASLHHTQTSSAYDSSHHALSHSQSAPVATLQQHDVENGYVFFSKHWLKPMQ